MTVSFQDQYHDWNGSQTRAQPILQRRKIETVFRIPRDNSHKMIEPTPVGRIVTLQVSWPRARFTIWIIGSRQKHLTCGEISILFLTHESTTSSFNRNMVSTSWPSLNRYSTIIRINIFSKNDRRMIQLAAVHVMTKPEQDLKDQSSFSMFP